MNRQRGFRLKRPLLAVAGCILLLVVSVVGYNTYASYAIGQLEEDNVRLGRKLIFGEYASRGDRPGILLIHGFDGSPLDWKPLTSVLRQEHRGFRAMLLPGHAVSPRLLENTDVESWLGFAVSTYRQMQRQYGEVVVVGSSMGASVALALAAREDVPKLVLLSPYFRSTRRWYIPGQPELWAPWFESVIPYVPKIGAPPINDPTGRMAYKRFAEFSPIRALTQLHRMGTMAMDSISQVHSPTLWIHSRGDRMADFDLSREMFDALPTEDKCFIPYDRGNHILLHDYDRMDVIQRILQFLDGGCAAALSEPF